MTQIIVVSLCASLVSLIYHYALGLFVLFGFKFDFADPTDFSANFFIFGYIVSCIANFIDVLNNYRKSGSWYQC